MSKARRRERRTVPPPAGLCPPLPASSSPAASAPSSEPPFDAAQRRRLLDEQGSPPGRRGPPSSPTPAVRPRAPRWIMQCFCRQPKRSASQENILREQSRRVAALNGIRLGKGHVGQTLGASARWQPLRFCLFFPLRRGSAPPLRLFLNS